MLDLKNLDIASMAQEADRQAEKEVRSKLIGWLKGMAAEIYNLDVKADKMQAEADAHRAKAKEKRAQYERVLTGDISGLQLPELSLSGGEKQGEKQEK